MRLKIFLLLFSASLVGTGVWLMLEERREILAAVEALNKKWVPDFDLHSVAQVFIKTNTDSVLISKNDAIWIVDGKASQKANLAAVGELVQRIKTLKPAEEIVAGPAQFPGFELLEPDGRSAGTGTLVELRDQDAKRLAAIIIGKQSFAPPDPRSPFPPPPNGHFVVPAGSTGPVGVANDGFENISAKADDWIQEVSK